MLKRLLVAVALVATFTLTGCSSSSSCGSCSGSSSCGPGGCLRCESPCYGRSFCRHGRKMVDFLDVYFLNYDRHDPFRCDPCAGD
jgi:hypothetical protein